MRILRQQDAMDCGLACLLTISLEVKQGLRIRKFLPYGF